MLNISQIVLASVDILYYVTTYAFFNANEWFIKRYYHIGHVHECIFYCTDPMVKYLNLIMCIERWVACQFPFKYKSLCTKRRIYGAVICCALWAIVPRYTIYFILRAPEPTVPCGITFWWRVYYYSERFKKENCLQLFNIHKFGFSKKLYDIIEFVILIGTFATIPLILLLVFGILTLRALKHSEPGKTKGQAEGVARTQVSSQGKRNALESGLSDTIIEKRKERNRMLTKLVLGLVFVNFLYSLTQGFDLLYRLEYDYGIKTYFGAKLVNDLLGMKVDLCVKRGFEILWSFIFLFNPVIYIRYNAAAKNNIKSFCKCFKK